MLSNTKILWMINYAADGDSRGGNWQFDPNFGAALTAAEIHEEKIMPLMPIATLNKYLWRPP